MKRVLFLILAGALMAGFAGNLYAQQTLGDAARENRKSKKPKAVKVYDNDNLPTNAAISVVGVVNAPAESGAKPKQSDAKTTDTDAKTKDADQGGTQDVASHGDTNQADARQKALDELKTEIDQQRAKVADVTHELDLLNREYRLRTALYYSDAGYRLRAPQAWAEEDQKYRDNISAKEQALSAAQSKLADLEEAARKSGLTSKAVE